MPDIFKNARSALQDFFVRRRQATAADAPPTDGVLASARSPLASDLLSALDTSDSARLLELLRPQPGLAAALRDLQRAGRLRPLFSDASINHSIGAIDSLEKLRMQTSVSGERFGSMLRELEAPELLTLALLLSDDGSARASNNAEQSVQSAQQTLDLLHVAGDARQTVEFLVRNQLQMSLIAFRQDTSDPSVI